MYSGTENFKNNTAEVVIAKPLMQYSSTVYLACI